MSVEKSKRYYVLLEERGDWVKTHWTCSADSIRAYPAGRAKALEALRTARRAFPNYKFKLSAGR